MPLAQGAAGQRLITGSTLLFESLDVSPPDAILRLIAEYRDDPRNTRIDLGVGVYRDEQGETPILSSVKKAERLLIESQTSKSYLGSAGEPAYNAGMQRLVFGEQHAASGRIRTVQTPGGSGALRVAAGLILRARPGAAVHASDPTWANHVPLLGGAGLALELYPYYDAAKCALRYADMLDRLESLPAGHIVLLHGCCHNPTGMDLDAEQWREVADVIAGKRLVPFLDFAYQGFAAGLEEDALPVSLLFDRVPEMIVCSSCSKNFGLYRDRVGALSVVAEDAATAGKIHSQLMNIVRTLYSMPPDHGGAVVAGILGDDALRAEWTAEVAAMRERLAAMRRLLADALKDAAPGRDFSHITRAKGMFSFLGVSPEQVEALKRDHGVYMVDSSRINVAGITPQNAGYLAEAVAAVL